MKIYNVRITMPLIVYAVLATVGAVVLWRLWSGRADQRWEGYYRSTILSGLYNNAPSVQDQSLAACQDLVAHRPAHVAARLYLGTLQLRRMDFSAAQKTFEDLAALPAAGPTEQAWARIGAAVAYFNAQPKDRRAAAAAEVEQKYLVPALAGPNAGNPDVLANLALVQLLKNPNAYAEADRYCQQAFGAAMPPSRDASTQLYVLNGAIQAWKGKPAEAVEAFKAAHALRPSWDVPLANSRMAMLAGVIQPNLPGDARLNLLRQTEAQATQFGQKEQALIANALGLGYSMLGTIPDIATAKEKFKQALRADPKDARAYLNLAALLEERINTIGSQFSVPVVGFTGEVQAPDFWTDKKPGPAAALSNDDRRRNMDVCTLLKEEADLWNAFFAKTNEPQAERFMAKLRQVNCVRRLRYLTGDTVYKADALLELAKGLVALDNKSGQAEFTLGMVCYDLGDSANACQAFERAHELGVKTPELERMLAGLSRKIELVACRPSEKIRGFGARPVISATVKTGAGVGRVRDVKMTVDGRAQEVVIRGSQVLSLATDTDLAEGPHTVAVIVTDAAGTATPLTPFTYDMRTQPPTCSVVPDAGDITPNQRWKITLGSQTGLDLRTVNVHLKSVKGSGEKPIDKDLVKDGRYRVMLTDLKPPVPLNGIVTESFTIGLPERLSPGQYELKLNVQDVRGHSLPVSKVYNVR